MPSITTLIKAALPAVGGFAAMTGVIGLFFYCLLNGGQA